MFFTSLLHRAEYWLSAGERARRLHERWLTRAMARPDRYPTIPVRPVSEGGFASLHTTAHGAQWAAGWWESTLGLMDDDE
jgi:hypothetical protein